MEQVTYSDPSLYCLLNEAVDGLAIKPNGIYIDGTFGRGGHSRRILSLVRRTRPLDCD